MSSFKGYSFHNEYIVNILFCVYLYACTSVQKQHIGNIGYVDELKVVGNTFKTLILIRPFNGKGNYVQFLRKGNNFQYISSGRYLFFLPHFWKLTNLPNARIFCPREKTNGNMFAGVRNSTFPNHWGKKSNMNRRPKMRLKKFPKTTLLHIWWLAVKKSCC